MKFQIQQKKIDFKIQIDSNVPQNITSDVKRLKQVLFNLIGNAVKFTYVGEIILRARVNEN